MRNRLLTYLLGFFVLSQSLSASDLYWVNGSGDFEEPSHWSLSSGGEPANVIPGENDRVFFDNNSFTEENPVVNLNSEVKIISINGLFAEFEFNSSESSSLHVLDLIKLNPNTKGEFQGDLILAYSNDQTLLNNTTGEIDFEKGISFYQSNQGNTSTLANNPGNGLHLLHTITVTSTDVTCNGADDGTATVTINGGTGPFTIQWFVDGDPYSNDATITGLGPGTYTVMVVDHGDGDATEWGFATIQEPATLAIIIFSYTDPLCNGDCNGTITAMHVPFTGTEPVTVDWAGAGDSPTAWANTGLCAGTYTATATDAEGCTATATQVLTDPPLLTATTTVTNVTCNGDDDGCAAAVPTGGTPVYTYSWVDGGAAPAGDASGTITTCALAPGTYTVTVTDDNGCETTATAEITEPDPLAVSAVVTDVTCNGDDDGSIDATVTGGTTVYTYLWDDAGASETEDISGLAPGDYTLDVTDANGCTASTTETVIEPDVLTVVVTGNDMSCFGVCDGDATMTPADGTPPYTYSWDDGAAQTTQTATALCQGVITGIVTDANGCTATGSVLINEPDQIVITEISVTDATCNGDCDGAVDVTVTGGTAPLAYAWDSGTPAVEDVVDLCAGTWEITVTDANGCVETSTHTVNEPDPVTGTVTPTDVLCNGDCNGEVTVTPAGGNGAPYTYAWDDGGSSTTQTVTDLCAGDYTVTITDTDGCTGTATGAIAEPDPIVVSGVVTDVTCNGDCDGEIDATITGGTLPYTYLWDSGPTTEDITGLCPADYTLDVTDANGCTGSNTETVVEPDLLVITTDLVTNVSCSGGNDGAIDVTITGGTAPYTYSWDDPLSTATEDIAGLTAGDYTLTVTDANGCTATVTETVTEPDPIVIAEDVVTEPTCNGDCDGAITVSVIGGTLPYTYLWDDPAMTATEDIGAILCAGDYTLTVTDVNGCTGTLTVTVGEPDPVTGTVTPTDVLCNGDCNGEVTVTPAGGNGAPYTYAWDDGGSSTTQTVTDLCAGDYEVTITDPDGCTGTATGTINEPDALVVSGAITDVTCNGDCDGEIDITVTGGTTAYTYLWDAAAGNATTEDVADLCAGDYTVDVTDANGCTASTTETVSEPDLLVITTDLITNVTCNGDSDGAIDVTVTGGTAPYTYSWDDPLSTATEDIAGVPAGDYTLTVTDVNGCTATVTETVTEPDPIVIAEDIVIEPTCNGDCDGSISVSMIGGTLPYTYLWDDPAMTSTEDVGAILCAGDYTLTVTDANGCTGTLTVTVGEPDPVTGVGIVTEPTCNGLCDGEIDLTPGGGTPGYTFAWGVSAGSAITEDVTGLCAGDHDVVITDANGCIGNETITVGEPDPFVVTVTTTDATCDGICDGTALATPAGGTGPYTYLWDPNVNAYQQPTADADSLCVGDWDVEATDANGCTGTGTGTVDAPDVVTATIISQTNTTCNGDCDGEATVGGAGGTPPYTYDWSPTSDLNAATSGLCAGDHYGYVIDANGCLDSALVTITEPDPIVITLTPTDPLCFGDSNGEITSVVTGGTGAYTYLWDDGAGTTTADISGLPDGTYCLTVTDVNGCTATECVTLTEPTEITAVTFSIDPTCADSCDGTAAAQPVGGTPPFTFLWDFGGSTNDSIFNVCDGVFNVTITDDNGCTQAGIVTLTDPLPLTIASSFNDPTCNGICNGDATVTPGGGTPPYSYSWDDPGSQTTATALSLCDGEYVGTVTDNNGCIITDTVTLTEPDPIVITVDLITEPTCNGDCDGAIDISVTGGVAPYTYLWMPLSVTTEDISALCAGDYTIVVTDANGCQETLVVTVTEPDVVSATATITDVTCYGDCDGEITIVATGGDGGPYTYLWDDPSASTASSVNALCAGDYTVSLEDASGCLGSETFTVGTPDTLEANLTPTDVLCFGDCDGEIASDVTGGTAPYTYLWDGGLDPTNDTIVGLCEGTYNVTVTDANGCIVNDSDVINEPTQITASIIDTVHVICGCTGEAEVAAIGGTGPYTYLWDDGAGQNTSRATGLCAGDYNVMVTDANGCFVIVPVTIETNIDLDAIITNTVDATCNGACDGELEVTASGGVAPYTYLWNDVLAQTTATAVGLCAGDYTCEVTDANGCTFSVNGTVSEPDPVDATYTIVEPSCNGDCDGEATITPIGGNGGPYTYTWDDPLAQTTLTATSLCAGTYNVTLSDVIGCAGIAVVEVTEPDVLVANEEGINISCNGACDGQAISVPTGGTAPYTYSWDDAGSSTTDTVPGLCPGDYIITVTDANGCVDVAPAVTLTEPDPLTSSITNSVDVFCSCTGSAEVTPVGGTAPYTYLWNDITAQTTQTAVDLCAGTYEVTVTDANGCTSTSTVIIIDASGFSASITDTIHNDCNGDCNGIAIATPVGGLEPYSYVWTSSANTDSTETGLCAGDYFATVSDANGCTQNLPFTIEEPDAITIVIAENVSIDCNGNCNGELEAVISGGTAPYTLVWDDAGASTTNVISGLCADSYMVTVTDANGCIQTATYNLTQPAILTALIDVYNDVTCSGNGDGEITATYGGGTAPVTYLWAPGGEVTETISSLSPGTFTVTITDANGCSDDTSQVIVEPMPLTSTIISSVMNVCNGDCAGEATVEASGGTAPYTYLWDDALTQTTATAAGLCAGTYNVLITDANGCTSTSTVVITEPDAIVIALDSSTETDCMICDGTAEVSVTGGTGAYTYLWTDDSNTTTNTVGGLCASTYTVTVTDDEGCTESLDVSITGPGGLTAAIVSTTETSCFGECDGEIEGTGVAGSGVYTYSWNDGTSQTSATATGLCAGEYEVTVTDSDGCIAYATGTITEPDSLDAFITSTTETACNLPGTGSATVDQIGGNGPYTYAWDPSGQTSNLALGLVASNYVATVTDANGCTDTAIAVITGPNNLTINLISASDISCNGECDGQIDVEASGGTVPYSYEWDDDDSSTSSSISGLCAGTYTCTVTDANGCQVQYVHVITEPDALSGSFTASTMVSCNGACDGELTFTPTGGTGAYSYSWSSPPAAPGQTTSTISGLCPGTYTLFYGDANGCTAVASMDITEPDALIAQIDSETHLTCTGVCDGEATASATGGTAPYSYAWEDALNTPVGVAATATGLCAETYDVTVTDANGCTAGAQAVINDTDALAISTSDTDVTCNGDNDGSAEVTITGGASPYTINWSNGPTSSDISNLSPNTYNVTVVDDNGCTLNGSVEITEPDVLVSNITSSTDLDCFNVCDGDATVSVTGGTTPYTYDWGVSGNNQATPTATSLCSGLHTVNVVDSNGCTTSTAVILNQPLEIDISLVAQIDVSCYGDSTGSFIISSSGGTGAHDYLWTGGPGFMLTTTMPTGLMATDYTVTVTDENGCEQTEVFTMNQPDELFAFITDTTHVLCVGICDGEAIAQGFGGSGPYTYEWDGVPGGMVNSGLCDGTYTVIVEDNNGCTASTDVTINTNNALSAQLNTTNVTCNGDCDGEMEAIPLGGTAPYSYSWNGIPGTSVSSGLCPTTQIVTVEDATGCSISLSGTVYEPAVLTASIIDTTNLLCNGVCEGTATVGPQGGTAPYTYLWDANSLGDQQTTYIATDLCASNYDVIVTDANGCMTVAEVSLTEPSQLNYASSSQAASCNNVNDGSADFTITGGAGGYSYSWTGPDDFQSSTEDITSASVGTYVVTAIDANGCAVEDTVVITSIGTVNAYAGPDQTICSSDSITLVGAGGTEYSWSNGVQDSMNTVFPDVPTMYVLTVSDMGCIDQDTVWVTVNEQPVANAGLDQSTIAGNEVQLDGEGAGVGGTYSWNPPLYLNDPTLEDPIATPEQTMVYELVVENSNGCSDTDYVEVTVVPGIVFPNGITPNGDGLNDDWDIQYIDQYEAPVVEIYNRWGQLLFRSVGYVENWDGTYNGNNLPVGTYYYVIELGEGAPSYTGPITIVR